MKQEITYMIQNGGDPEAWLVGSEESELMDKGLEGKELDEYWDRRKRKKKKTQRAKVITYIYHRGTAEAVRFTDLWEAWKLAQKLHAVVWVAGKRGPHHIATTEEIMKAREEANKRGTDHS